VEHTGVIEDFSFRESACISAEKEGELGQFPSLSGAATRERISANLTWTRREVLNPLGNPRNMVKMREWAAKP
jgi:hypothetical protein